MIWIIITLWILLFLAFWVLWLRDWLKHQSWAQGFFATIEPIEIALWRKSETILWARIQQLLGAITGVLSFIGVIDLSPFLFTLPEKYRPWVAAAPSMAISINGIITELLRRGTTKPVEIQELPANVSPEVAAVVKEAETTKVAAVEAVKEAKEEHKL